MSRAERVDYEAIFANAHETCRGAYGDEGEGYDYAKGGEVIKTDLATLLREPEAMERVARALYATLHPEGTWEADTKVMRLIYTHHARAAIAALLGGAA